MAPLRMIGTLHGRQTSENELKPVCKLTFLVSLIVKLKQSRLLVLFSLLLYLLPDCAITITTIALGSLHLPASLGCRV